MHLWPTIVVFVLACVTLTPSSTEVVVKTKKATFQEAAKSCRKLAGGNLVNILDKEKQKKIEDAIKASGSKEPNMWIGLSGTGNKAKNKYDLQWPDGTAYDPKKSFQKFHGSDPDNDGQVCVFMTTGNDGISLGKWEDESCGGKRAYICEYTAKTCKSHKECPKCKGSRKKHRSCTNGTCECTGKKNTSKIDVAPAKPHVKTSKNKPTKPSVTKSTVPAVPKPPTNTKPAGPSETKTVVPTGNKHTAPTVTSGSKPAVLPVNMPNVPTKNKPAVLPVNMPNVPTENKPAVRPVNKPNVPTMNKPAVRPVNKPNVPTRIEHTKPITASNPTATRRRKPSTLQGPPPIYVQLYKPAKKFYAIFTTKGKYGRNYRWLVVNPNK